MTDLSAEFSNADRSLATNQLSRQWRGLLSFHGDYFCFRWMFKVNGNSERLMSCKVIDDLRGQIDADILANAIFEQWQEHVAKFDSANDVI